MRSRLAGLKLFIQAFDTARRTRGMLTSRAWLPARSTRQEHRCEPVPSVPASVRVVPVMARQSAICIELELHRPNTSRLSRSELVQAALTSSAIWRRVTRDDALWRTRAPSPSLPLKSRGVTRVHARSRATPFGLQIPLVCPRRMRRETSRASFLMCPFPVCAMMSTEATCQVPPTRDLPQRLG